MIDHQVTLARRGFPVNGSKIITGYIFLDEFKLHVVSYSPDLLDAGIRESVRNGQQLIFAHLYVRWINRYHGIGRKTKASRKKSDGRAGENIDRTKRVFPTLYRS